MILIQTKCKVRISQIHVNTRMLTEQLIPQISNEEKLDFQNCETYMETLQPAISFVAFGSEATKLQLFFSGS